MTEAKLIEIYRYLHNINNNYKACIRPLSDISNPSTSFFHIIDGANINFQRLSTELSKNNIEIFFDSKQKDYELYFTVEV